MPNFTFWRGREHKTTTSLFFSCTLTQSFRIKKKLPTFDALNVMRLARLSLKQHELIFLKVTLSRRGRERDNLVPRVHKPWSEICVSEWTDSGVLRQERTMSFSYRAVSSGRSRRADLCTVNAKSCVTYLYIEINHKNLSERALYFEWIIMPNTKSQTRFQEAARQLSCFGMSELNKMAKKLTGLISENEIAELWGDFHIPESIVFNLHCYSCSVLYPCIAIHQHLLLFMLCYLLYISDSGVWKTTPNSWLKLNRTNLRTRKNYYRWMNDIYFVRRICNEKTSVHIRNCSENKPMFWRKSTRR